MMKTCLNEENIRPDMLENLAFLIYHEADVRAEVLLYSSKASDLQANEEIPTVFLQCQ